MTWKPELGEMRTTNAQDFEYLRGCFSAVSFNVEGLAQGKTDKGFMHDGILFRLITPV